MKWKSACWLRADARSLLILYLHGYGFTKNSKEMTMGDSMLRDDSNEVTSGMDRIRYRYKPLKTANAWLRFSYFRYGCVWTAFDSPKFGW